ncbi:3D domain-containing protein [uncultured Megamonas sp.]|uniref:3D domain-containing protein n=1 Tax=uncultured Megamonas sp. TaxID=286140 RepID=UPI0026700FB7|nr:3D domain-containing protein [uncultured Megamonas sp.]
MDFKNLLNHNLTKCKLTVVVILCFAMATLTGFVTANKNITIVADGNEMVVNTVYDNPKNILKQAGIKLNNGDDYTVSTDKITDNSVITINRAMPVNVEIDGDIKTVRTTKKTVGELISSMNLDEDKYFVEGDKNTQLHTDAKVKVLNVSSKLVLRDEVQNYQVIKEPDSALARGNEEVIQVGRNGLNRLLVREKYHKGVKVGEEVVQTSQLVRPVDQVIREGTAEPKIQSTIGLRSYSQMLYMEASAYLPYDGGGAGYTALGIPARYGVVAVDPDIIPLGTRLYIPGYGEAIAADTGGAINGYMIDLCMEDYTQAIAFGRRGVEVYILD